MLFPRWHVSNGSCCIRKLRKFNKTKKVDFPTTNDPFMTGNHHQESEVKQVHQAKMHITVLHTLAERSCLMYLRNKSIKTNVESKQVKPLLTSDLDLFLHIHPSMEQDISSPWFYLLWGQLCIPWFLRKNSGIYFKLIYLQYYHHKIIFHKLHFLIA